MAIFSMNISNVSRASGSTSCATLSYISAEKIFDRRIGKTFNYGRGERVLAVETVLPNNAPSEFSSAEELFNSIELHEKAANARTAKKVMVALPRELSLEENKQILDEFIQENITSMNYACTYAVHCDVEGNNPHAHILIANRQINDEGEWGGKRKMEYVLDENGERIPLIDKNTGQQKVDKNNRKQWKRISVDQNPLDKKETLHGFRSNWAEVVNRYLEEEQRIDYRSNEERGLDLIPTKHEGYAARKIEERGGVSEICENNRQIRKLNELIKSIAEKIKDLIKERFSVENTEPSPKPQRETLDTNDKSNATDAPYAYVMLHEVYVKVHERNDRGKVFNKVTLPLGVVVNNKDLSGARIYPSDDAVIRFSPTMYSIKLESNKKLPVNLEDGSVVLTTGKELAEAVDRANREYLAKNKDRIEAAAAKLSRTQPRQRPRSRQRDDDLEL